MPMYGSGVWLISFNLLFCAAAKYLSLRVPQCVGTSPSQSTPEDL